MSTTSIRVPLAERSYTIEVGHGLLPQSAQWIGGWLTQRFGAGKPGLACIVTDTNVTAHADVVQASLTNAGWRTGRFVLESGEKSKRLSVISAAYDQLVELQADRRTVIVAVGGGVVGDAAGFIAATFNRGLPFVQVPTTLLSNVDSSVGGKVGINHPQAKNLIGAFHQPLGVLIDTAVLQTLPDREFRSGLAEVVKYGVILDAAFFARLEQLTPAINRRDDQALREIIAHSCQLKANVVEHDEYERTGLRAVLNYGHTFAHAFEALAGYGELLHGEAVAIGMVFASQLSERLNRIDSATTQRQIRLLQALHLPVSLPKPTAFSVDAILNVMRLDKKTVGGKLRFVLPARMGHVELVDGVDERLVSDVLIEGGISAE